MTAMDDWARRGATLSDKTAREQFGLTQEQIETAIADGSLHYRIASMHGNPWLRLLRREVEEFVRVTHGQRYLTERLARAELGEINREVKRLTAQLAELDQRRSRLMAELGA